ncbi:type VI secretion system baseplate subunit TssF [Marinobacter lutaoensis]|jgi:type VI secretion system protein ImpG|uniref:Type VI secretion protein n=1 Tax=Marinobacter lutaoensis TaxID=135739 RepID=A0A1V2DPF3_9GAMM|nr:type VI secretion system baseplate subunit TssF [Marinobacter lutaoensis]MBE03096.1 type VI secretion system baseplate subunit TssF [Marinobacter sp.]MBI43828.1 type VI secretion system baseplate subunit TssF [Oceanospirillales bacterium]ONF42276.1 type VI secretion protein [Marinobacter lutaoensis]|tara:strand:- start:1437 stop:3209 length:1773 start_codon:yes stop_codon:yes gene_type:complete
MKLNRFYRDELSFLRLQGREFAEAHPQLTRFLSEQSTDPDVERLLEGFAFLTGKLREKVEDEFPELTHSLLNMLWPNYLRPVPSGTVLRFDPQLHAISERQVVARHTEVKSRPLGDPGRQTQCRFRTCRSVAVFPMTVAEVTAEHSREVSSVTVDLALHTDQPLNALGLDPLRFYLGADDYTAQTLYLWLNHYLSGIELEVAGQICRLPASALQPVGFAEEEALLPYPRNAFPGYRILQEYLSYPEAFRFVDVQSLASRLPALPADEMRLRFHFNRILPADARITRDAFQLHCTPAINLFSHEGEPVDLNGRQTEYRIQPSSRSPDHYEVFSVDRVEGWLEGRSGRAEPRVYTAFESFQHEVERDRGRTALYYRVRVRDSVRGDGFDHHIAFVRGDESACLGRQEAVSLTLTCTNRELPRQLAVGDICMATETSPAFATFSNITRPTATVRPTLDGSLLWTLVSNLSLNYLSMLDVDALRTVLRVYDFRALVDRQAERIAQQRLAAINAIETRPVDRMIRGLPVRGIRSELYLDQQGFASEGDLYLFGTVLSRFFALYASINAFHQLDVVNTDNQERYTWTLQQGQQPLM